MRNIFILYMPPGNLEAMAHYEDTIKKKVSQERIFRYLDSNLKNRLREVFRDKPIAVWGSRDSGGNRSHFEKMQTGDDVLIAEGAKIKLLGKIAAKTVSEDLSRELWKNINVKSYDGWNLIYFIANAVEINMPFTEFKKILRYKENWSLRGFTSVSDDKLHGFYDRYDDLYSILLKVKQGEGIEEIRETAEVERTYQASPEPSAPMNDTPEEKDLSDHVRMQWKLMKLGLKTGSNVWIPVNDQKRIEKEYHFHEFEKEFATGIDVEGKYVENIDVVWKEEFRIDAAFEIENTTAVYSGLLRFSDLKIVAPNSIYPLYIVAPLNKKNRVFEQIRRPTFRKIGFDKKVKYLSYEAVDDLDRFFETSTGGFNIDVLDGKAMAVT